MKFRLSRRRASQSDVKIALERIDLKEVLAVEVSSAEIVVDETGTKVADAVDLIRAEMIEYHKKCSRQFVLTVARNVKFRLSQVETSRLDAKNVLPNIAKDK